MCGIIGIIAKQPNGFFQPHIEIFRQMLYANAVRGTDATGAFGVNKYGNIDIIKAAQDANTFINDEEFDAFCKKGYQSYHFMIGHNRKATHGEKDSKSAHPFWDKDNKICLIHNGMISNYKSFCSEATVDSAAITNELANREDPYEIFSEIEGSYAMIWYDVEKKRLNFMRNSLRPLYVSETADCFIISSEDSLAYWIAKRNNQTITSTGHFEEMVPYYIDMEDKILYKTDKVELKKKTFSPATQQQPGTNNCGITTQGINDTEETHYFSTDDFKTPQDVLDKIKSTDSLLCTIDSYEETPNKKGYKVTLNMINVDVPFIVCEMYMKKFLFNSFALSTVIEATVMSLCLTENKVKIFLKNPIEIKNFQISMNDVIVEENMWLSDKFPLECDVCSINVKYADLPKSSVWISDQSITALVCPKCSGEKQHD